MADVLRLPLALWVHIPYLDQTLSFLGSAFKIALFYIIVARPISEFGVQPAIECADVVDFTFAT